MDLHQSNTISQEHKEICCHASIDLALLQEYFQLFARHMKSSVLKQLPVEFNRLTEQSTASEGKDMIPRPDLENYVLCQVLEDCGNVELDDQG